ncbi:MAG TPA: DUF3579 domain-containing protein [Gallionella sp.]|nr:DUF3579 domain-containing protein [Gallionella sp.]
MNPQPALYELLSATSPVSGDKHMQPSELVILGVTETGEVFDIPNWPERLCGLLSVNIQGKRIRYSDYLRPARINGCPAVILLSSMAQDNPEFFAIVAQFVAENKLKTRTGRTGLSTEAHLPFQHERRSYIKG